MKKTINPSPLLENLFQTLTDHAFLVSNGIPNDQALRIAFGKAVADKTLEDLKKKKEGEK